MTDVREDPRFIPAIQMVERTGAKDFRIGYSDPADGDPTVWYAVVTYPGGMGEAAAALDPLGAVFRLCEQIVDGGTCLHCHRPTIFDPDPPMDHPLEDLLDTMGCRYAWDPELATFRRSCEGDTDD